ncbi:hypothetical protein MPSEU_000119900 [Mayamaea pseudoterrestris]|nr:hypothetical protein MPSEU_000119900 [Mayamaea pseudoterrestris]
MGKSSKNSTSKEASTPKCTCTDPFKCDCGHRPERPSRGHKWDSASQTYKGKGHRQKGASGQVASVAIKTVSTQAGTKLEGWQALPSTLLDEYTRKQKRPHAKYASISANGSSSGNGDEKKYRYRVILPDPKQSDKDFMFAPVQAVANVEQAKEEAALLALLHLTPNMPHERKLPEPYRQTWLNAVQKNQNDKKQVNETKADEAPRETSSTQQSTLSTTNPTLAQASSNLVTSSAFVSHAERRAHQDRLKQIRNARMRHHEAVRLANMPHKIFMSAKMRAQVEALLRGEQFADLKSNEDDDEEDEDDEEADPAQDDATRDLRDYVMQRLVHEGFTRRQAKAAFQQSHHDNHIIAAAPNDEAAWDDSYEASLQWLLVHLTDDQLPEGFDPQQGMLDVISAPKVKQPTPEHDGLANMYSLTHEDASHLAASASGQSVEQAFWNVIVSVSGVSLDIDNRSDIDADTTSTNKELLDAEIEAVTSIYGDACCVSTDEVETKISVQIPDTELTLEFVVKNGAYPSVWPSRCIVSGAWDSRKPIGVALHVELLQFMTTNLALGDFMVLEILSHVQQLLSSCDYLPTMSLNPLVSLDKANGNSKSSTKESITAPRQASSKPSIKNVFNQRRPRERAKFWSVLPVHTPPAVAFPKISHLMKAARESLPAASARTEFLKKLDACSKTGNVMLVTGSTGCGKTTQICQIILETFPKDAKIVVAQPRRLAATGVATRVAEERGEQRPGVDSVGYVVRGDSAICDRTRLVFCTTGVLLRQLQNEKALDCLSHILIDECHERSLDSDILLGLLKQIKSSYPQLKIILMSATIDAERMAAYWGPRTPTMDIPGRTFPVTDFTLEDVFALTHSSNTDAIDDLCTHAKTLDYDLMGRLLVALISRRDKGDDGSILIFLPGAPEINKASEAIKRRAEGMSLLLLPLHGGLQSKDQSVVFRPPPFGSTKVILSTNIAETSVTIPDCTVVIDSCREKQSSYDPSNRMPLLVEQYASKASLKQRRGRAGRVRAGICYKLVSKRTLASLAEHTEPEIQRCSLDQTLLSLLFLGVEDGLGSFTRTLLDPPSNQSLRAASESLKSLGAIEDDDHSRGTLRLTPLGKHLAGIPAPPVIGKLLVMGSILGCRTAALGMAAGLSLTRSPFLNLDFPRKPRNQQQDEEESPEATKTRRILKSRLEMAEKMGNSDHALLAAIYIDWMSSRSDGGGRRKHLCESIGLNLPAMKEIEQLGKLLDSALTSIGFRASAEADRNLNSPRIIQACAVSAMSPAQLVKVVRPKTTYDETAQGAKEKDNRSRDLKFFIRLLSDGTTEGTREEQVYVHPASSNFSTGTYSCPWLVYFQLLRTSKAFLRDVTECSPYALLLLGGPLTVQASKDLILIDNWAALSANARIGSLVGGLRKQIDALLAAKTADASMDISNTDAMKLITSILKTDGIGGSA